MIADLPYIHIARIVLEADTAFAINSGLSDSGFDKLLVREVNGLPTIPATAIAGVLRHRYQDLYGKAETEQVFGYANSEKDTKVSPVAFSWGCVHNSNNQPVQGIDYHLHEDPLLHQLAKAHYLHREKVSLSHRGVAREQMKYDTSLIPAGCRFSMEMSFWSKEENDTYWHNLLGLFTQTLRFGSATRSGIGQFCVKQQHWDSFHLADAEGLQHYSQLSQRLEDVALLRHTTCPEGDKQSVEITLNMDLHAEDFFRFGQPDAPLTTQEHSNIDTMLAEPIIQWCDKKQNTHKHKIMPQEGHLTTRQRHIIIPASGIKGALAHRLVFHYNCLRQYYVSDMPIDKKVIASLTTESKAIQQIFGFAHDTDEQQQTTGQAGVIFFSDVRLDVDKAQAIKTMQHNSIDRFTGGTRAGALYAEELVWQQSLPFQLRIDRQRAKEIDPVCRLALDRTLQDLAQGRLALGAASSRGHGYFQADYGVKQWSDEGRWIKGESQDE